MKKHVCIFATVVIVLVLAVLITYTALISARPSNKSSISSDLIPITVLNYEEIIELPSIYENEFGFTCTGMTYDHKRDSFWIANYGKINQSQNEAKPSIVQVSKDFKTIKSEIIIYDDAVDVQGVSYDETTDTLWYSNGSFVINCSTVGEILKQFDLGEYEKYRPNGVLFDSQTKSLWVLCFYNYLLNFDIDGNLLRVVYSDYVGQDHLCFSEDRKLCFSVGNDYHGEANYVVVYSPETMAIDCAYQVVGSYSIEGISIIGSTLYVANDGYYHEAKINKNYIAIYNLEN